MKLVFWLSIVLICFCVANASEASPAAKPAQTSSDYDLQSLVWEHDAIFNGVLDWALEKGVLSSKQAATLQAELEARLQAFADLPGTDVNARRRIYTFISSRLSVPSLLAGLGLLILALITLAAVLYWADTPILTVVSIIGIGIWWVIAAALGQTVQWQVLGVCIFVIPITLVATASYGLQAAIKLPETPYEFILPEVSTILFGSFLYYRFGFSFLLVPVLIAGYLLSLDIMHISLNRKRREADEFAFMASWVYGLIVILLGYALESETNYIGQWCYSVGGFAFIGGLVPFILFSSNLVNEVVFLTSAAALIYACTNIQRAILLVYGGLGISIYMAKSLMTLHTTCNVTTAAIYFRAFFSVLFFSLAVIRFTPNHLIPVGRTALASYAGFTEWTCGFWLLMLHALSWPVKIARGPQIISRSRALTFTAHLVTSIGLVGISRMLKHMSFSVITTVIDVDCGTIVAFVGGCSLILNHCSALILDIGAGLGITAKANNGSQHVQGTNSMIKPGMAASKEKAFSLSRVVIILLVGCLSSVTPTNTFARSSVISLIFLSWVEFIYKGPTTERKAQMVGPHWLVSACAFVLAHHFGLGYLQYICLGCMFAFTQMAVRGMKPVLPALLIGWLAMGLTLDSLIVLGVTALLVCLSFLHVAKHAKTQNRKQLRSAALAALAISASASVYFFLHYDYFHSINGGVFLTINNTRDEAITWARQYIDQVADPEAFSLLHLAANAVAWPLPLSNAIISEGDYILFILILIGVVTAVTELVTWAYKKWFQEIPVDESIPALMDIQQMTVHFPKDTGENGIVFGLKGPKPPGFEMDNATLYIIGDEFWNALSNMFGVAEVELFRTTRYPFKLFPNRLSKKHFHKLEDEQMWFQFGTACLKEPAYSQSNIRSTLRKLVSYGDPELTIRVIYSSRKMSPKKALLFEFDIRASLILNSIREGFQLKPLLSEW